MHCKTLSCIAFNTTQCFIALHPGRRPLKTASRLLESERWDGCRNELKCMMWVICLVYKRAAPLSKNIHNRPKANAKWWTLTSVWNIQSCGEPAHWKPTKHSKGHLLILLCSICSAAICAWYYFNPILVSDIFEQCLVSFLAALVVLYLPLAPVPL